MNLLFRLLDTLTGINVSELTDRFVQVYELASEALSPADQATAKAALADAREDNDMAKVRLVQKLEAARDQ